MEPQATNPQLSTSDFAAALQAATFDVETLIAANPSSDGYLENLQAATDRMSTARARFEAARAARDVELQAWLPAVDPTKGLHVLQSKETGQIAVADEHAEKLALIKGTGENAYKQAFQSFLRGANRLDRHDLGILDTVQKHALNEGLDVEGGYLVPDEFYREIVTRKPHPTQVMSRVRRYNTGSHRLKLPIYRGGNDVYNSGLRWQFAGERGTTTEDSSLKNFGEITIDVQNASMDVAMTNDIREDSFFPLDDFVRDMVMSADALERERYAVSADGSGVNRPKGILASVGTGLDQFASENIGNPISGDGIMALESALPKQYRDNATFVMNSGSVYRTVQQLKAGTSEYIGFVSGLNDNGLAGPRQLRMLGYEVLLSAFMPDTGAGNDVMLFGDLGEAYMWLDRVGIVAYPYGQSDRASLVTNTQGVVFRCRFGGHPYQARALRVGRQS